LQLVTFTYPQVAQLLKTEWYLQADELLARAEFQHLQSKRIGNKIPYFIPSDTHFTQMHL
jgi:hypothetical protein